MKKFLSRLIVLQYQFPCAASSKVFMARRGLLKTAQILLNSAAKII